MPGEGAEAQGRRMALSLGHGFRVATLVSSLTFSFAAASLARAAAPVAPSAPPSSSPSSAPASSAPTALNSSNPLRPLIVQGQIGPGWRSVTLPAQGVPVSVYSVQPLPAEVAGQRHALRMQAQASYGNLVHELPAVPAPSALSWSWMLALANPAVNLANKEGDDLPAKVCVSFDLPLDLVPFGERQLLRLARARMGQELPAATLCWVWSVNEAKGAVIENAFSRRVRYLVVRQRGDGLNTWFDERRDLAQDFARAFPELRAATAPALPPVLPPVTAVILAADADNTAGQSLAWLTALRWWP